MRISVLLFSFLILCITTHAADDGQLFAFADAQWESDQRNDQPASLPEDAVVVEWDTPYHGNLKFLSNGRISLAARVPHEVIAVYEQDGEIERVYDFGLCSSSNALSSGETRFNNGCVARSHGLNENGEKNWNVEIVGPNGEQLAEHNFGLEYINGIWSEHTATSSDGRYLVSRRLGPFRVHAVIKDLQTGAERLLGQVGMPDFSPDGSCVAFYANKKVTIYSCEALFADDESAAAIE